MNEKFCPHYAFDVADCAPCLRTALAASEARVKELAAERDGLLTQITYERNEIRVRQSLLRAAEEQVKGMREATSERVAQLLAHRAVGGIEHDPQNSKFHGNCVVCVRPWPCEYAGTPPAPARISGEEKPTIAGLCHKCKNGENVFRGVDEWVHGVHGSRVRCDASDLRDLHYGPVKGQPWRPDAALDKAREGM